MRCRCLREAYGLDLALDDRWRMALLACRLATALIGLGESERGSRLSPVERLARRHGRRPGVAAQNEREVARLRGELGEAAFTEAWEAGRMLTADEAVALALAELGADA